MYFRCLWDCLSPTRFQKYMDNVLSFVPFAVKLIVFLFWKGGEGSRGRVQKKILNVSSFTYLMV